MTIQDAIDLRIGRLTLPEWEDSAVLQLPLTRDGQCGMVARIHDSAGDCEVLVTVLLADTETRWTAAGEGATKP